MANRQRRTQAKVGYQLELETRAKKELSKLAARIQESLAESLDDLQKNPRPPGAKRLVGGVGYRLRKGDYRVLYTINGQKKLVRIFRIGHRREVYR